MTVEERNEILESLAVYGAHCIAVGQADRAPNVKVIAEERMKRAHRRLTDALDEHTVHGEAEMTSLELLS